MSHQIKNNSDFYVLGGTLKPDAPSYIERNADRELYEHILSLAIPLKLSIYISINPMHRQLRETRRNC